MLRQGGKPPYHLRLRHTLKAHVQSNLWDTWSSRLPRARRLFAFIEGHGGRGLLSSPIIISDCQALGNEHTDSFSYYEEWVSWRRASIGRERIDLEKDEEVMHTSHGN